MEKKPRIEYIDLAKGICILLVVYIHVMDFLKIHPPLNQMMAAFRMPLYFFLSGLFFKRYEGFIPFIKRKTNKLLIPFAFFFITFSVLLPNLLHLVGYQVRNSDNLGFLKSFCTIFIPDVRSFSNGAIWFLLCLFWVNVMFYLVMMLADRMNKNKVIIISTVCLILGMIGLYMSENQIYLPLYIDSAIVALPFFCCGFLANRYTDILIHNKYDRYNPVFILALGVYVYFFSVKVSFLGFNFGNGFFLYTCGVFGTLMIMLIAKILQKVPFISYIGRYSIIVLCTHMVVMQAIAFIVKKIITNDYAQAGCVFIITVACNLIIIPLCLKFLPYVTAQKDIIQIPNN